MDTNQIWKEVASEELKGTPLFLDESKLHKLKTDNDREMIDDRIGR